MHSRAVHYFLKENEIKLYMIVCYTLFAKHNRRRNKWQEMPTYAAVAPNDRARDSGLAANDRALADCNILHQYATSETKKLCMHEKQSA
jgi:hypothetical protein